jgi:hypothetical protein
MPQQMQRNATTNAKKCHNKCKEMPQQMQKMPQQMQQQMQTNAELCIINANICRTQCCNKCIFFGRGPDPSRVVLSDQVTSYLFVRLSKRSENPEYGVKGFGGWVFLLYQNLYNIYIYFLKKEKNFRKYL